MSILDEIVVFEDESSTLTKKNTKSSNKKSKPKKSKPKKYDKFDGPINSVYELTLEQLNVYFNDIKKSSKKEFNLLFKGKKTLLDSLLKENDVFREFAVINTEGILSNKFISIGFKYVAKREIADLAKYYVLLDVDRRVPLLVESKYMDLLEFSEHRDKIYKQFM